jgi:hypothetical protein
LNLAALGGSSNYLFTTNDSTGFFSINGSTMNVNAPTTGSPYTVNVTVHDTTSGATGTIALTITIS